MPPVDFFKRVGNLANRGPGTRGVDGEREQVAGLLLRCLGQSEQRLVAGCLVPAAAYCLEPLNLGLSHGRVVDIEDVDFRFFVLLILVDADDRLLAAVDSRLAQSG
jgi:hypothetical protein